MRYLLLLFLLGCERTVHRKMEVRRVASCMEICEVWLTNGSHAKVWALNPQPGDSVWVDIPASEAP